MPLQRYIKKKNRAPAYILIGDGFDELEVVYFLHELRQAGLSIKCVSLFDSLVFSRQGVGIKADCSLADHPIHREENCWLILPSGGHNGETLRRDARVKTLLKTLHATNSRVVVTDGSSNLAEEVTTLMTHKQSLLPHAGQNLVDFVQVLTHKMTMA